MLAACLQIEVAQHFERSPISVPAQQAPRYSMSFTAVEHLPTVKVLGTKEWGFLPQISFYLKWYWKNSVPASLALHWRGALVTLTVRPTSAQQSRFKAGLTVQKESYGPVL
jgi:hypothetical protein